MRLRTRLWRTLVWWALWPVRRVWLWAERERMWREIEKARTLPRVVLPRKERRDIWRAARKAARRSHE